MMRTRTKLPAVLLLLSLAFPVGLVALGAEGTDSQKLSLAEAQEYAVKHSTSTQNARLDVSAAKKKIWETTASGLPQVNAKISYMNNLKIPTTLIPAEFLDPNAEPGSFIGVKFGTQHNATLELTVDQLIFNGSYIVGLQASRIYLQLSREQLTKSEIDVKETVTNTYYLILLAEDNRETLETNLENIRKTLYETKELHRAGFSEDTDVDQLQLAVTDLENAVNSIKRQIEISYNLLKFQLGFDLQKEIRLSQSLEDILTDINGQELLTTEFKLFNHIDYRMMDTREKSFKLLLKKEKADYLPTISTFFSHSRMAMRDSFNFFSKREWYPSSAIGLNINIPIFGSGMQRARVAQAQMELQKAGNLKKQAADGLQLELLQSRSAFADALEKKQGSKQNVDLAKKIYDKTLVKYANGTTSSLELTQVHNQYLTAESNYTRAVVELLTAKTRLDKALNRL
ncbi:MAG: TolC family protein [Acidobacteriota bacterium]|nr:TolC family protein [Acidobacteriota bacterium]